MWVHDTEWWRCKSNWQCKLTLLFHSLALNLPETKLRSWGLQESSCILTCSKISCNFDPRGTQVWKHGCMSPFSPVYCPVLRWKIWSIRQHSMPGTKWHTCTEKVRIRGFYLQISVSSIQKRISNSKFVKNLAKWTFKNYKFSVFKLS